MRARQKEKQLSLDFKELPKNLKKELAKKDRAIAVYAIELGRLRTDLQNKIENLNKKIRNDGTTASYHFKGQKEAYEDALKEIKIVIKHLS